MANFFLFFFILVIKLLDVSRLLDLLVMRSFWAKDDFQCRFL